MSGPGKECVAAYGFEFPVVDDDWAALRRSWLDRVPGGAAKATLPL